ncbi:MAG: hypothetical protein CMJ58_07140 [Planctomycetaceae bacterium]|nr:hypothetical protein [Planctomycetaceae bacterium]
MTPQPAAIAPALARLTAADAWSYGPGQGSVAEPAAWCALALAGHGHAEAARQPAQWLADLQQSDGSVGMSPELESPRWCTSLAMLAWRAVDFERNEQHFAPAIAAAARWALSDRGKTNPRDPRIGHDTTLTGWSWAADTHSWLEPTCFFVMALRACGYGEHPRVREGVRLIADRLLPDGGANYGNTIVLGQTLVPHLQPSGIALLALAAEQDSLGAVADGPQRVQATVDYLHGAVNEQTSPASLAYAALALTACDRRPRYVEQLLGAKLAASAGDPSKAMATPLPMSLYETALLALATEPAATHFASLVGPVAARPEVAAS